MGVKIELKGSWKDTERYLAKMKNDDLFASLSKFGAAGVAALESATPVESRATASSWSYEIVQRKGYYSIRWFNSNSEDGRQVAILLQYGHATKNGGYVQGRDYINPAIRPIFDGIEAELRKVVRG